MALPKMLIAATSIVLAVNGQATINYTRSVQSCPIIQCVLYDEYMEPNNICLYHQKPGQVINLRSCGDNPNQVCDLYSIDFAWT